jgi:hypothetical protein
VSDKKDTKPRQPNKQFREEYGAGVSFPLIPRGETLESMAEKSYRSLDKERDLFPGSHGGDGNAH